MEEIKPPKQSGFIVAIRIEDRELDIRVESVGKALNLASTIITGSTDGSLDNPDHQVSLRYERG